MAHRVRPGAALARAGYDEAAKPLDLESVFHLAESGRGSLARSAGIGWHHDGGVSQAPRFRDGAAARHSGCPVQPATGGALRVPQRERGYRQERHRQYARILRAPAGGGPCGSGAGRSIRHRPAHSHLLCNVDGGTGARRRSPPSVHCEKLVDMEKPIRLTPSLREKVWGKTHLSPWYPDSATPIGESWFLGPHELPLLVKLIFTGQRLSVQVHPDDGEDGPRGKNEMWHILEAAPGATIAMGFREPITRERLWDATRTGDLEHLLHWAPVKAGETYLIPAHTVHAIGAGIVLCEIQQNSDVTYRLWDYGRPRQIHVEKAVPISDLGVHPGASRAVPAGEGREEVARSKHFVTELVRLKAGGRFRPAAEKCQLWICLEGRGTIGAEAFQAGEVWLLPDEGEQAPIVAGGGAGVLRAGAPGEGGPGWPLTSQMCIWRWGGDSHQE